MDNTIGNDSTAALFRQAIETNPQFAADAAKFFSEYNQIFGNTKGATTGDASTQLNDGLANTASLYGDDKCVPPQQEPPAEQPQQPSNPYAGAADFPGATKHLERGDNRFEQADSHLRNVNDQLQDLAQEGNSPADIRSYKHQILRELREARHDVRLGNRNFGRAAEQLGVAGDPEGGIQEGRQELRASKGYINDMIRQVKHGRFDAALGLTGLTDAHIRNGVGNVRDGVSGDDWLT